MRDYIVKHDGNIVQKRLGHQKPNVPKKYNVIEVDDVREFDIDKKERLLLF